MLNKNIVTQIIEQKIFDSLLIDKFINEIFQSINKNVYVTIKQITFDINDKYRIKKIINVDVYKIKIINIFN